MAKIPTILSDASVRTGSTSPLANPSDLVVDDNIDVGLQNLSRGARSIVGTKLAIDQQRKASDDARWVNDSIGQERFYLHNWAKTAMEKDDENVGENFWKHANERISQYEQSAPSPKAAEAYKAQIGDFIFSRYVGLTKFGQDLKIDKTILSINDQIKNALGIYRESSVMPESLSELNKEYERLGAYIDQVFGVLAPNRARDLKENLAIEMALGTMDKNPGFAKMIIELDKNLDERSRTSLKNQLDQSLKESRKLYADTFEMQRKDHIVRVEAGKEGSKLPLRLYQAVYDGAEAERQKRADDFEIDVHLRVNQFMDAFAGKNAGALTRKFDGLFKDMATLEDKAVLRILDDKVRNVVTLQQKNRVAWLNQYNPEIQRLNKEVEEAPTPFDRQRALSLRNATMKKYQGRAPANDPDKDRYLDLSTDDVSLLDVGIATETARAINRGTASEVLAKIDQLMAEFPDDQDKHIALRDLVTLPPATQALREDYRMVITHRDKFWVDSLAGALDKVGELGKLNPATKNDVLKEIDKNSTWLKFRRTHVTDNSQRADEVDGYREAILAFANSFMVQQGMDAKGAADKSINLLVKSELGFTSVNGQPLAITKQRGPGQPNRTEEEIADHGRRLEIALEHLDPRNVNLDNFPALKKFQTDETKWNFFYEQLRERGFFQLSPDGQSVSIYFSDDVGLPFQLTDTQGKELRIYLDELPDFLSTTHPLAQHRRIPAYPKDRDIYETEGNFLGLGNLFGTKRTVTNWPGMPYWIRSGKREGHPHVVDDKYLPPERRGN